MVIWGFWKCLLWGCTQLLGLQITVVVVVLSLLGRGRWNGYVCMMRIPGGLRGSLPILIYYSPPPPQRWRRRALALRRWCPAHPRPLHLLGSTSHASCAMTSPLATTMGSALVKAARCVCGGGVGGGTHWVDTLPGEIRDQGPEQRGDTLCVSGHPSGARGLLCTEVVNRLGQAWGNLQGL